MESRPWRRLSPVARSEFFRSLLHGPLKLHLWAHSLLPLAPSKYLILCLTFHHGRADSIRTDLALPFSSRTVGLHGKIYLFISAENRTETQNMGSLLWPPAEAPLQRWGYPFTTHEERLGREEAGTGLLPNPLSSH